MRPRRSPNAGGSTRDNLHNSFAASWTGLSSAPWKRIAGGATRAPACWRPTFSVTSDNEPVLACPPSRAYHVKKADQPTSRHLAGAIGGIIVALSVGLVVATYAFFVAEQRRASAELASSRAQTIARALNEMLESADP